MIEFWNLFCIAANFTFSLQYIYSNIFFAIFSDHKVMVLKINLLLEIECYNFSI
jgi:hypothetical protein